MEGGEVGQRGGESESRWRVGQTNGSVKRDSLNEGSCLGKWLSHLLWERSKPPSVLNVRPLSTVCHLVVILATTDQIMGQGRFGTLGKVQQVGRKAEQSVAPAENFQEIRGYVVGRSEMLNDS